MVHDRIKRNQRHTIQGPSEEWRNSANSGPGDPSSFSRALEEIDILDVLEVRAGPQAGVPIPHPVRIAFWNVERCKFVEASASLVENQNCNVALLAEMDLGMARSGNRHTTRELAGKTGQGYALAVEYVELDLGDARERTWHAGEKNTQGIHGGAILSLHSLLDPAVIRLELDGGWFDGTRGERRVGGRIAVAARIETEKGPIVVVSVHFERHSSPGLRVQQMEVLCKSLDRYAKNSPLLIGGDFNTSTIDFTSGEPSPGEKLEVMRDGIQRLHDPVAFEPMFGIARSYGLDWSDCNAPGPTQRTRPDGTPAPPFGKIDWFFTRGLKASAPAIVPAVDHEGNTISDHELIRVEVEF